MKTSKPPKITVHRSRQYVTPASRFYDVVWHISIDDDAFARIWSLAGTWHCHLVDGSLYSGDFHSLADARAWGTEMARRRIDPTRGPLVSRKGPYGHELAIDEPTDEEAREARRLRAQAMFDRSRRALGI